MKSCYNIPSKLSTACVPEYKVPIFKEIEEIIKRLNNRSNPSIIIEGNINAMQQLAMENISSKYGVPKGLLKSNGEFEMQPYHFSHSFDNSHLTEPIGNIRSCPPGYPEDIFYQRGKYMNIFPEEFHDSRNYRIDFGIDYAKSGDITGTWEVRLLDKLNWNKITLKHQQKTTDMKKTVPLSDVLLTDDERQKVSDEFALDKQAMSIAEDIAYHLRGKQFEEKKRVLKFLILAIDHQYQLEKDAVAGQIKKLEEVLLEKNSKGNAADELLK